MSNGYLGQVDYAKNQLVISRWLENLRQDLIREYDIQGRRASGKFEDGLEPIATATSATLLSHQYAEQLEFGRQPTVNGGDGAVRRAIEQWIQDKNIVATPDKDGNTPTDDQLAFLITRKIHREGWKANNTSDGGNAIGELISRVITPERIEELIDEVFVLNVIDIEAQIINFFSNAA